MEGAELNPCAPVPFRHSMVGRAGTGSHGKALRPSKFAVAGLGVLRDRNLEHAVATRGAYVLGVHRVRQDESPVESPETAFHSVLLQLLLIIALCAALVLAFTGERAPVSIRPLHCCFLRSADCRTSG